MTGDGIPPGVSLSPRRRLTTRMRLTLTFLGLFMLSAFVLVTLNYIVLVQLTQLPRGLPNPQQLTEFGIDLKPGDLQELRQVLGPSPEQVFIRVRDKARSDVLRRMMASSAVALVAAALISWVVGGRVARAAMAPVRNMTDVARRLSADTLHERIGHDGPDDELSELAATFDGMLDRLETAFNAHRSFGAYVSHELLTPLSTMRAEAELVTTDASSPVEARRLADVTIRQVDRSKDLVTGLLTLSRAEAGLKESGDIDLSEIVGDAVGELVQLADARRLDLRLDYVGEPNELIIRGDGPLLTALVHNLVRNAVQYNVVGGLVDVSLYSSPDVVMLRVENTGPQLTDADMAKIAAPFRRLERTRNQGAGHGLGTAIVAAVATMHGGAAKWSPRTGGGIRAEVVLRGPVERPSRPNAKHTR